jgi:hypothetical protein
MRIGENYLREVESAGEEPHFSFENGAGMKTFTFVCLYVCVLKGKSRLSFGVSNANAAAKHVCSTNNVVDSGKFI